MLPSCVWQHGSVSPACHTHREEGHFGRPDCPPGANLLCFCFDACHLHAPQCRCPGLTLAQVAFRGLKVDFLPKTQPNRSSQGHRGHELSLIGYKISQILYPCDRLRQIFTSKLATRSTSLSVSLCLRLQSYCSLQTQTWTPCPPSSLFT